MKNTKVALLVLGLAALALLFVGVGVANATPATNPSTSTAPMSEHKKACQAAYPSIAEHCKDKDIDCTNIPKSKHGFKLLDPAKDPDHLDGPVGEIGDGIGCELPVKASASASAPTGAVPSASKTKTATLPVTGSKTPVVVGVGVAAAVVGFLILFVARKKRDVQFVAEEEVTEEK